MKPKDVDKGFNKTIGYPPINKGGPIEAWAYRLTYPFESGYPPINKGGPIEAHTAQAPIEAVITISTYKQRWPH